MNTQSKIHFVVALVLATVVSSGVEGATNQSVRLQLRDGSVLFGQISHDHLLLNSQALGAIQIAFAQVQSVSVGKAARSDIIKLINGDEVRGTVQLPQLQITTLLGELAISREFLVELLVMDRQGVEWVVLPFPADSDWPAPRGEAAQVKDGEVLLRGQPVRSRDTFAVPCRIEFEFVCEEARSNDGAIGVQLLSPGQPLDQSVRECVQLWLGYHSPGGRDGFVMFQRFAASVRSETIWGEEPLRFETNSPTRLRLDLWPDKTVLTLGDQTIEASSVKLPYETFQIQLQGWQPTNHWRVKNLRVMPLKN